MRRPALHRTRRGDQRLRDDEPAEHAAATFGGRMPAEGVALDRLEVERGDEFGDALHGLGSGMAFPLVAQCI